MIKTDQVWVIVTELKLTPRTKFYGGYTITYLRSTDYSSCTENLTTDKLNYAMQLYSLDSCKSIMTEEFFKNHPNAFAISVSEITHDLHYLNQNNILHQKLKTLVDERYSRN